MPFSVGIAARINDHYGGRTLNFGAIYCGAIKVNGRKNHIRLEWVTSL